MSMNPDRQAGSVAGRGALVVNGLHRNLLFIATVFLLVLYLLTYLGEPAHRPIDADGAGYYAYLPALLIHGDPSFETDARVHYGGEFPAWTYVRRYPPTGRYLNSYPMGVAMMMTPFFLAGHALTYWFGWPWYSEAPMKYQFAPDGYSLIYQHAAGLSGLCYMLLSLALMKRLLDRLFPKGVVLGTLAAMTLGTNFIFYATRGSVCAHPYTLFLSAALIAMTEDWYRDGGSRRLAVGLGVVMALLLLVRPINILLLLWTPLYGMTDRAEIKERAAFIRSNWSALVWMAASGFLVMIPQFLMWNYSSGRFIVRSYQHIDASVFGAPQLAELLVGWQRGLIVWFPVFLLALAGFLTMKGSVAGYRAPAAAVVVLSLLVVSMNKYWTTAGGFGNRYAVDTLPFLMYPVASLYASVRSRTMKWALGLASGLAVFHALLLLTVVYRQEFGLDSMEGIKSPDRLFDVYWWRWKLLQEWWVGS